MAPASQATRIELRHLRAAIAAADCGSLRQASELLVVRHSVLSRLISQLEHLVGATLFERSSAGVVPTVAGRSVLCISRTILEQVEAMLATARSSGRGEAGRLSIGFCTSISAGNLRATIIEFKKGVPQVELAPIERPRALLMSALRNGTLDIAIVPGQTPLSDAKTLPVWSERTLAFVPNDHPLATREIIYWTDLRGQTVLLSEHDPGNDLEDLLVSKLVTDEHRPTIERHDVSRGIIKSLISMGLGIGLAMESDVGASFAGLVYRELHDGAGPSRIGFYARWLHDNENPALKRFLNLLAERYPSPPPVLVE
ncbi:LysR family transcriptional regulator [Bradyrhizobium sp. Gha]|uniref:LysR family transcriptional regulator n=1 Tax=Bradyrhizobium sp. Gha TaxID=1855318 RepID=UPI0008E698C4|nr:LysR family transcriptional regulator [Bradyrhizobium sp. Gha]SFH66171.1 DNA-binding transcriptional regulator, LysR family [Bradyrhizobium sp. Gha]